MVKRKVKRTKKIKSQGKGPEVDLRRGDIENVEKVLMKIGTTTAEEEGRDLKVVKVAQDAEGLPLENDIVIETTTVKIVATDKEMIVTREEIEKIGTLEERGMIGMSVIVSIREVKETTRTIVSIIITLRERGI